MSCSKIESSSCSLLAVPAAKNDTPHESPTLSTFMVFLLKYSNFRKLENKGHQLGFSLASKVMEFQMMRSLTDE